MPFMTEHLSASNAPAGEAGRLDVLGLALLSTASTKRWSRCA